MLFCQNTFNYEKYKHADEETVDFTKYIFEKILA